MNQEEEIHIKADLPFLKKYFEIEPMLINGKDLENYSIKKKYYDQVKGLLSEEYNIQDQQTIDNFCFVCLYTHSIVFGLTGIPDDKEKFINFLKECESIEKLILEKRKIKEIRIYPEGEKGAIKIKAWNIIEDIMRLTSKLKYIEGVGKVYEQHKRRKGGQKTYRTVLIKEVIMLIEKIIHESGISRIIDLSEYEKNYFIGMLFLIAGIIEPFPEEKNYLNLKDYLVKRMQKYRS